MKVFSLNAFNRVDHDAGAQDAASQSERKV
jgi:hypothetical protein